MREPGQEEGKKEVPKKGEVGRREGQRRQRSGGEERRCGRQRTPAVQVLRSLLDVADDGFTLQNLTM
jgi:hypothetical protein